MPERIACARCLHHVSSSDHSTRCRHHLAICNDGEVRMHMCLAFIALRCASVYNPFLQFGTLSSREQRLLHHVQVFVPSGLGWWWCRGWSHNTNTELDILLLPVRRRTFRLTLCAQRCNVHCVLRNRDLSDDYCTAIAACGSWRERGAVRWIHEEDGAI